MNAFEKALSLGLIGTDAEIVSQLQPITSQPINLTYLMELLNFRIYLKGYINVKSIKLLRKQTY